MVKRRDPTAMKRSEIVAEQYAEEVNPLEKQFKILEQHWDSIKQSTSRTSSRCSTGGADSVTGDDHLLQLLSNSPKSLMSSLQHHNTPSHGCPFNSRHADRAALEVLKEREAALDNCEFKGRRLFQETEIGSDESEEEICSECLDLVQESEVRTVSSYQGSDQCFVCHACGRQCSCSSAEGGTEVLEENERRDMVISDKRAGGGGTGGGMLGYGGRWMLRMAWVSFLVMLFTIGIVAIRCTDDGNEDFLVPT